jgi:hypothetical protein
MKISRSGQQGVSIIKLHDFTGFPANPVCFFLPDPCRGMSGINEKNPEGKSAAVATAYALPSVAGTLLR